jgi:iron complex outermembrane recepter protein
MKMKVALAIACLMVGAAYADEPAVSGKKYDLHIARQPLDTALKNLAEQTGLQIARYGASADGAVMVGPVFGALTTEQALENLLENQGLTYRFLNDRMIAIVDPKADTAAVLGALSTDGTRLRLAQGEGADALPSDQPEQVQSELTEIVVTAQKRRELLKNIPISITALSGADLDKSTIEGVAEALNTVPGVAAMQNWNGMGTRLSVRGVTPLGPWFSGSSPTGYYLDSIPFGLVRSALSPDAGAYDLERVEVLRGPQGTLYGASSLNGVVRILTHEADLNEFQFKARASGSTSEEGGGNYRGDMAINVPLIEGKLAARLAAGHENLSGWIDRPGEEDANDADIDTVRLKVKAKPAEKLTMDLTTWVHRSDYGAPSTGEDDQRHVSPFPEPHATDYDVFGLKLAYEFDSFMVTSSSSYMDYSGHSVLDLSPFCCAPLGSISDFDARFFTQEILASSTSEGSWRWSLGAFYRDANDRLVQSIIDTTAPNAGGLVIGFDDTSESWAVFGEVTRLLLDGRLELTAGLRQFQDRIGTRDNAVGATDSSSDDFDSLTPRFVITGHVTEDFLVYASYSEGFRSGLLQAPAAAAVGIPPVRPDTLKNYEIGSKVTLLDNRLSIDASVYYIDWVDAIQQGPIVLIRGIPSASLANGPASSGRGADLALSAQPIDRLTLGFTLSVNDLQLDENVIIPGIGVIALADDRLQGSPAETYGVFADYEFPLGQGSFTGVFAASANYISEVTATTTTVDGSGLLVAKSDPQIMSRASFGVRAPKNWEATVFVNNLTNEQDVITPNPYATASWDARPRPRTYGVQLEYRF